MRLSFLLASLMLYGALVGAETTLPAAVKRIGDGRYTFGLLSIDAKKREIAFPATINQTEGNVEYALVHDTGKTHESLLATAVRSTELQVALLLCRFQASTREAAKPEGRLGISIRWTDKESGEDRSAPLHSWVYNGLKEAPLDKHVWLFTGVPAAKPGEPPVEDLSLIAIFNDPYAAINCHDPESANDDLWYPTADKLPPVNTPVTVHIAPIPTSNPSP